MSVTIKDIAKKADVAISTVSYVLNNKSGAIKASEETRRKIFRIASELNYSPSIMAKGLREGKTYLAGIMLGSISGSFVPEILQGINDILHQNRYSMLLCMYEENEKSLEAKTEFLIQKKVDGIIIIPDRAIDFNLSSQKIMGKKLPLVFAGGKSRTKTKTCSVYVNEEMIGNLAAEYIFKTGHRDILAANDRRPKCLEAFKKTLTEKGINFRNNMMLKNYFSFDDGKKVIKLVKDKKITVSAVFAYNDILAAGMIYEAQKQGIKIPEDISILGIDNLPICKMVNPNITTVAQPQYEQGAKAAEILLSAINGKPLEDVVLSPYIIERESFIPRKNSIVL